jgi:hypothetical protein
MGLNVGLGESFGNMQDEKGIWKKAEEVIFRNLIKQMMRFPVIVTTRITLQT